MEASGPYYLNLANFLHDRQIKVFVVNPLKIKRFRQINFNRAKTGKKDAEVIHNYALKMKEDMWEWSPEPEHVKELKQLHSSIELLNF